MPEREGSPLRTLARIRLAGRMLGMEQLPPAGAAVERANHSGTRVTGVLTASASHVELHITRGNRCGSGAFPGHLLPGRELDRGRSPARLRARARRPRLPLSRPADGGLRVPLAAARASRAVKCSSPKSAPPNSCLRTKRHSQGPFRCFVTDPPFPDLGLGGGRCRCCHRAGDRRRGCLARVGKRCGICHGGKHRLESAPR